MSMLKTAHHQAERDLFGNFVIGNSGFSIDGNSNDVETDNAVTLVIGGIAYALGAQSAIDISGLTGSGVGLVIEDGEAAVVVVCSNSAGTLTVVADAAVVNGTGPYKTPTIANTVVAIGAVVIENESGSDFTVGTTGLDTSGVTDTYYSLVRLPATLAGG